LRDRLLCPVLARPGGNMQPFSHGFQAGPLDNLGPLQGGKSAAGDRCGGHAPPPRRGPVVGIGGTPARSWSDRSLPAKRLAECVHRPRRPVQYGHAELDTKVEFGFSPTAAEPVHQPA
jgi:hypothetical protein